MENVLVKRTRLAGIAAALVFAVLAVTFSPPGADALGTPGREYKGITLLSLPPKPGITYDVDLVDSLPALDKFVAALDIIFRESPFSAGKIEALKKNGRVGIIYDPNHPDPKTSMASIQVAEFLPHYREIGGNGSKKYIAVVGRHGIKWPVRELAAVLVHELVGHGIQHLYDRLATTRNVDLECEAWLYEELAHQDFHFDKFSREMIQFRQQLEGVGFINGYCTDFKRHMQKNNPDRIKLWESLNPDVPKLLVAFEDYLRDLRETGVTGALLAAVKKLGEAEKEKIYNEGSPEEQYQVAGMQLSGFRKQPDHAAAAKWYQRAAAGGHAKAQYVLAVIYDKGRGVPRDRAEAAKWYRKAGEQGVVLAQYRLGVMFATGAGVLRNVAEAVTWYRKAAEKGLPAAQIKIGFLYEKGREIAQDLTEAVKWYRKAAEQVNANGQYNLGIMYSEGSGVARDGNEAAKWYRKAAVQGYPDAQNNLGVSYEKGWGVPKDYAEAAKWYRKAGGQGLDVAQINLAGMYRRGQGVPKDYSKAAEWYRKAAEKGHNRAQYALGSMYAKGKGVKKDLSEAAKWMRLPADQGHAGAQYVLANMYSAGKGVAKDQEQAFFWLTLSADRAKGKLKKKVTAKRNKLAKSLDPARIAEIEGRAREWRPK